MTRRRWARDSDPGDDMVGPVEEAVHAELEELGFDPLTPPGPLRTAAQRALALAETYDRTQNAVALPPLDRQLSTVMAEARTSVQPGALRDPEKAEGEVTDFEERRRRREQGS